MNTNQCYMFQHQESSLSPEFQIGPYVSLSQAEYLFENNEAEFMSIFNNKSNSIDIALIINSDIMFQKIFNSDEYDMLRIYIPHGDRPITININMEKIDIFYRICNNAPEVLRYIAVTYLIYDIIAFEYLVGIGAFIKNKLICKYSLPRINS